MKIAALLLLLGMVLSVASCILRPVTHVAGQANRIFEKTVDADVLGGRVYVRTANASWAESIAEWKGRVRNRHLTLKGAA